MGITIELALQKKKNNFDFLRLIAAIIVIFTHSFPLNGYTAPTVFFIQATSGSLAVYCFLIISGFLVAMSWSRSKSTISFLTSRILRIFPALMPLILFTVFVIGGLVTSLPGKEYFSAPETLSYFKNFFLYWINYSLPGVFNNNVSAVVNGSLWTLPYEFTFYFFVPFFLFIRRAWIIMLFAIILLLKAIPLEDVTMLSMGSHTWFVFLAYFCAGVLSYQFRDKIIADHKYALLCLVILAFSWFRRDIGTIVLSPFLIPYLILYLALHPRIKLPRASHYGDLSYGTYIYAFPIQQTIIHLFGGSMNPFLCFFLSMPIILCLAFLSWHLVEKRFLGLKKYLFGEKKKVKLLVKGA